ncbi:phosphoribosylaminoimidazole-succinocarboxamide synthase [Spirochaetota bacterium]|nr:phosphoribosylaminoimidazole-succinocarboxamide synthase [Spirochaetota bacterium]
MNENSMIIIERALKQGRILKETDFSFCGERRVGKVRDMYDRKRDLVMITTDRQSAFDRVLAEVPFKGQVLSQVSGYWFDETEDIVKNHIIESPHPNVHIVKKLAMFPVEFVVRGYLTGVSATSVWTAYARGDRKFAGHDLPDGLVKNVKFPEPLVTPSTKSDHGDETISVADIVTRGLMTERDRDACVEIVLELFARGQALAHKNGLILVDTKYELGRDEKGNIVLADEIHTPDSSRYWLAEDYEARIKNNQEPKYIDKEFLRLWFKENSNPYKDASLPEAPSELISELARRYVLFYEKITGKSFDYREAHWDVPLTAEIKKALTP